MIMKKILALAIVSALALFSLIGCSKGTNDPVEPDSSDPAPVVYDVTCADKYSTVVSDLGLGIGGAWSDVGEDYMAWLGFDGSEYDDFAGAFQNGTVDVFIIVRPANGQADVVREKLQKQLDTLIGQNENYPGVNKDKVEAGKVIDTPDGFIVLCIYGNDEVVESDGAEAALQPMLDSMNTVG